MFAHIGKPQASHSDDNPLSEWDNEMPIDEILDSHNNAIIQEQIDDKSAAALLTLYAVVKQYGITPELADALGRLSPEGSAIPSPRLVSGWTAEQRKAEGVRLVESLTSIAATEDLKEKVHEILSHYKIVAVAAVATLQASIGGLRKLEPGQVVAHAVITAAIAGAELYLADKIVNRNRVYGSYDVTSAIIAEMSQRDDLIKKIQTIAVPKTNEDYPQYANELKPLSDALAGYGYLLADTFVSFKKDKISSASKFKLEVFSDSGWDPESFKHTMTGFDAVVKQIQKQAPMLSRMADSFDRVVGTVKGNEAAVMLSKLTACLMADQAEDGKLVARSLKSASRFFTTKQLRVVGT